MEAYLDYLLLASLKQRETSEQQVSAAEPLHCAVREVYDEWGIFSSVGKSVTGADALVARGALIDGKAGLARPNYDKIARFISLFWHLCREGHVSNFEGLNGAGVVCFFLQFERHAFCLLQHTWESLEDCVSDTVRWRVVVEEFASIICVLPLLHINFRMRISPVVSVSDASEQGAGVAISRNLTPAGQEAMHQRLCGIPNLLSGKIVLHES